MNRFELLKVVHNQQKKNINKLATVSWVFRHSNMKLSDAKQFVNDNI